MRKHLWSNHYTSPAGVIYNESNVVHGINVFEGKTLQTSSEFNILYKFELFEIALYGITFVSRLFKNLGET